jgi:cytochrome P450
MQIVLVHVLRMWPLYELVHASQLAPDPPSPAAAAASCSRETLRKDTIVPALSRIAAKDFELNGYLVPEGTSITVPLKYFSLHDPRWVGGEGELDPSAFNPERMLTPEGSKPGWQMPFGYGPR